MVQSKCTSVVQSVVDIDGTATFVDPGNIEKEKKGPSTPTLDRSAVLRTETRCLARGVANHARKFQERTCAIHQQQLVSSISQQREEMRDKLKALGIVSETVVITDTPHPFWVFHPWFDSTVEYVDEFLRRTMRIK